MAQQVIALRIGNASIPLYADDWPAIKAAVEEALAKGAGRAKGSRDLIAASRHTVADKSRLLAEA